LRDQDFLEDVAGSSVFAHEQVAKADEDEWFVAADAQLE
jgi:hypothetical protein